MSKRPESPSLAWLGADPEESELVVALNDSVARFASKEIVAPAIDREHSIPARVLEGLADLGLFGISIPERWGGAGLSLQAVCSVIAELAQSDRSVATTVGLHLGLGTRGLVDLGSPELTDRYLPALASGEKIAAFATTEPEAGSDLSAIKTTAVRHGDQLLINGAKAFVTNANLASVFTITASTPGMGGARRGHSLILVDGESLEIGGEEDKLGLRGSSTAPIFFDDVRVPADHLIGEPGKGMSHLAHVLACGRTVMAAGCVGAAESCLQRVLRHTSTRRQFGRTLDAFEVVQRQVADMAAMHFAMGAIVRHTAMVDRFRESFHARSLSAKIFCSESGWSIADLCVQLHGGAGFIEEGGVPLLLRDARITRIFEGANDVLLVRAGTFVVASPPTRSPIGDDVADGIHDGLVGEADRLKSLHGIKLMRRQADLHRLGQLAVLSEVSDAAVLRARAETSDDALRLTGHWLSRARVRASSILCDVSPGPVAVIAQSLRQRLNL